MRNVKKFKSLSRTGWSRAPRGSNRKLKERRGNGFFRKKHSSTRVIPNKSRQCCLISSGHLINPDIVASLFLVLCFFGNRSSHTNLHLSFILPCVWEIKTFFSSIRCPRSTIKGNAPSVLEAWISRSRMCVQFTHKDLRTFHVFEFNIREFHVERCTWISRKFSRVNLFTQYVKVAWMLRETLRSIRKSCVNITVKDVRKFHVYLVTFIQRTFYVNLFTEYVKVAWILRL